ncbi:MAG: penicillin-binding transpeptidase domain-containing protein [Nannocystaceae bacterium]
MPAVRLAAELEAGELLAFLHQLGFQSLGEPAEHYGLALALGSGEVELRELAAAYVALARGGERIPLRLRVDDPAALGRELPEGTGVPIVERDVAAQITEILADPLARVRGLHGRGPFTLAYPVAVKTGTSSGYRDTWAIGYTHERTVAVWVGNADGSGTQSLTGASGAGHLFAAVMERAMADVPTRAPLWEGERLQSVEVCALSGDLPGPACEHRASHLVAEANMPQGTCSMHQHVRPDPASPSGWRCDPRGRTVATVLPDAYEEWILAHAPGSPESPWMTRAAVPGCADEAGALPTLRVTSPALGSVILLGDRGGAAAQVVDVRLEVDPPGLAAAIGEVEWVVDGVGVARSPYPYRAQLPIRAGDHEVLARPVDPRRAARFEPSRFSVR